MPEIPPNAALIAICATLPSGQLERRMPMPKSRVVLKAYTLRLPDELYRAIERIAEAEIRPVNSQMLVFLRQAVDKWQAEHPAPDDVSHGE